MSQHNWENVIDEVARGEELSPEAPHLLPEGAIGGTMPTTHLPEVGLQLPDEYRLQQQQLRSASRLDRDSSSVRSMGSMRSIRSELLKRQRDSEMQAAKELAELKKAELRIDQEMELKKAELRIDKELINMRLEFEKANYADEMEDLGITVDAPGQPTGNLMTTQDWVDKIPEDPAISPNHAKIDDSSVPQQGLPPAPVGTPCHSIKSTSSSQQALDTLAVALTAMAKSQEEAAKAQLQSTAALIQAKDGDKSQNKDKFFARQTMGRELPAFGGNPAEWLGFISQYRETTKACNFTDQENMYRLKKCLKGAALLAVQPLLISPDSVNEVMKALEDSFGRPELIIKTLMETARKVKAPKEDDPHAVMEFARAVQHLDVTIRSFKRDHHMRNPILMDELVSKLPTSIRTAWVRDPKSDAQDGVLLTTFTEWIMKYARDVTRDLPPKLISEEKTKTPANQGNKKEKTTPTCTVLSTTDEKPGGNKPAFKCAHCDKDGHSIYKCRSFEKLNNQQRWEFVKEKRLCFSCLKRGHRGVDCRSTTSCEVDSCQRKHHTLLHRSESATDQGSSKGNEPPTATKDAEKEVAKEVSHHNIHSTRRILLRVAPIILTGPKGEVKTYAMLDDCSTCTMIDQKVASQLGLQGIAEPFETQWLNSITNEEADSKLVFLKIRGVHKDAKQFDLFDVRTTKSLNLPTQTVDAKTIADRWEHIRSDWPSFQDAKPTIIIGEDNWKLLVPQKVVEGPWNGPVATLTRLGWIIHGNLDRKAKIGRQYTFHAIVVEKTDDEKLHQLIKSSFSTEAFGVKVVETPTSKECKKALEILDSTTTKVDGHFQTGLLWKNDIVNLPESKPMALRRLYSLEKKLDKEPQFAEMYYPKMMENFAKGYARKLSNEEASITTPRTWYLPHFGVQHPQKPGKVRIVFDAAAKSHGVSLNDNLCVGPDLLNSLGAILMRFRRNRIGISADVKDFFPSIKIIPSDRTAQRFLWRGQERDRSPDVYEMDAMIFGAKSSPFSANAVKHRNAKEHAEAYPEATKAILEDHYMDDFLGGAENEEDAIKLINDVTEVHSHGGFQICNWISSSREVLRHIPANLTKPNMKNLCPGEELPTERVLGMWWNAEEDTFVFDLRIQSMDPRLVSGERIPTKREVLRIVMSIFDPLGLLSHFIIQAKVILQNIWRSGIEWDDELSEGVKDQWTLWIKELMEAKDLKIPRLYLGNFHDAQDRQLHIFSDASDKAFAAVAYLRLETGGAAEVTLVFAKARVAPLKLMSIPRLELQGAVTATRIGATIQKELNISSATTYWTDSMTVLHWIRNDTYQFKQFVAFRIGEIQETTNADQWRWISSKENVADEATKRSKAVDFSTTSRWFQGPDFLRRQQHEWPTEVPKPDEVEATELELKTAYVGVTCEKVPLPAMPDVGRFSRWIRMIRAAAMVPKCAKKWLRTIRPNQPAIVWEITPMDLITAEENLWKVVQRESFPDDYALLMKDKQLGKSNTLFQLSPVLDENGVIRLGGRIDNAKVDLAVKRPVILHSHHPFSRMLLQHYHEKFAHTGQEAIVNELRQRYWIIGIRRAIRGISANCVFCKIKRANPMVPMMGQLPLARLEHGYQPFYNTGLDYFGPIDVVRGRAREKRYGVLFTCLATRAVHLEIAHKLDTTSCIQAIRRMVARRGLPRRIYSDNGTNFKGADRTLREALDAMDQSQLSVKCASQGVEWHFNPPESPHMGGAWERLVRSVKTALMAVLGSRTVNDETLLTLFCEAENIVNSRPLTYVSGDPSDPEALTPNHFLVHRSSASQSPGEFSDRDFIPNHQWKVVQRLADHFWIRWVNEYLPTLIRRGKWHQLQKPVQVDSIVMIVDQNLPRNTWIKGKVVKVYPGQDGQVRVVDILTKNGTYKRSVSKIVLIDNGPTSVGEEDKPPTRGEHVADEA